MKKLRRIVIPVETGIQVSNNILKIVKDWIPAFAGMTVFFLTIPLSPVFATPYAFPVPFVARQHTQITFKDLPSSGTIKVVTPTGSEVVTLDIPTGAGIMSWDVTNASGKALATGVYLFLIDGAGEKSIGKFVVIR